MSKNKPNNSMTKNASTAWKELTTMVGIGKEETASAALDTLDERAAAAPVPAMRTHHEPDSGPVLPRPESKASTATTVIDSDTVIEGTIRTQGNIQCAGTIQGDLFAKGVVSVSGIHTGNIESTKLTLSHARVKGNISCEGEVIIDNETEVTGDICAGSIILNGKIYGCVMVKGLLELQESALLSGNVEATRISIKEGALVLGEIKMDLPNAKKSS